MADPTNSAAELERDCRLHYCGFSVASKTGRNREEEEEEEEEREGGG